MSRFCPKCGTNMKDEAVFCGKCGAKFNDYIAGDADAVSRADAGGLTLGDTGLIKGDVTSASASVGGVHIHVGMGGEPGAKRAEPSTAKEDEVDRAERESALEKASDVLNQLERATQELEKMWHGSLVRMLFGGGKFEAKIGECAELRREVSRCLEAAYGYEYDAYEGPYWDFMCTKDRDPERLLGVLKAEIAHLSSYL